MKSFRSEIRTRALTTLGILPQEILNDDIKLTELDRHLISMAGLHLAYAELAVFIWLYSCEESWDTITASYERHMGDKTVNSSNLQRTKRRVRTKLVNAIADNHEHARRLRAWAPQ